MTIEFTKFVGRAPVLEAILVTAENVEELAVWMGADTYSVEKTLVGGNRKVTFKKIHKSNTSREYAHPIVEVQIGHYLVRYPERQDDYLREYDERFFSVTQADITNFQKQMRENQEIDPNSRADDKE